MTSESSAHYDQPAPMTMEQLALELSREDDLLISIKYGNIEEITQYIETHTKEELKLVFPGAMGRAMRSRKACEILQILFEAGADPNDTTSEHPLFTALKFDHPPIIQLLLKFGADANAMATHEYTMLQFAAGNSRNISVIDTLLAHKADIDAPSKYHKETPLHCAARNGHGETVRFLLDKGANEYLHDRNGRLPRGLAVHHKQYHISPVFERFPSPATSLGPRPKV